MATKRSLVNQTINELTVLLRRENYQVGQKLPVEAELAKMLKVGRSTLREAVKILVFSNILEVKQGSGTYLKIISADTEFSTEDLLTARSMIEIQAAESIIQTGYELSEMIQLKELLFQRNQLLAQGKFSDFVEIDEQFHLSYVTLSKNSFLIRWYQEILTPLKLYQSTELVKTSDYQDNTELHNQQYEALIEKDLVKAKAAIKKNGRRG